MDLLRSTIKSLFYDYPLDAVAAYIGNGTYVDSSDFYSRIKELLKLREKGFSMSEIGLLESVLKDEWLSDKDMEFASDKPYHPYERIFLILQHCANDLLEVSRPSPCVKIQQLLRWRDLSLLVGEDNLVIPLLARCDIQNKVKRHSFLWPNVLDHDDVQLNGILNETLSDTHFHLNAGCDIFEFNWLILMNHVDALDSEQIPEFMKDDSMHDYDPVKRYSELNLPLAHWVKIASYLRALLFNMLYSDSSIVPSLTYDNLFRKESFRDISKVTNRLIEPVKHDTIKTSNGIIFDYAITNSSISQLNDDEINNVYLVHHGERKLLYDFFKRYYGGEEIIRRHAPHLYLYILIKNKMRRELIQTNDIRGFENFQWYQSFKSFFYKDVGDYKGITETAFRYSIQSAVGAFRSHNVEARITPGSIGLYQELDYKKSIFGKKEVITNDDKCSVTLVCHFIKSKDSEPANRETRSLRHKILRKCLRQDFRRIEKAWNNNETAHPKLVGIDAASNELICRPEVFAPVYRNSRRIGLTNFTYHVGEDFYDIVDGLRAIDEAIDFLGLSSGSRIGHAIALGIDADSYYTKRHRYIIIPKQELLDNLVWLKYKAMDYNIRLQPKTEYVISTNFSKLMSEIGYGNVEFSDADYWESMKLRCEDPLENMDFSESPKHRILEMYWYDADINSNGKRTETLQLPHSFSSDVSKIQKRILSDIEKNGLFIETNPTSNFMIGGFDKYIDLPLFRFHSLDDDETKLPVSINTDDKGVFATSLKNEFSLIAVALRKERNEDGTRKWNDKQIMDYIRQIAYYGNLSRFS